MPRTRKVASKKTVAKKSTKTAASKRPVKKKAAAKRPVKKTTSKKSKSTKAPKKTTSKKKATPQAPDSKNKKYLPKFPTSITLRNRLSMIALSPYRLPLDTDRLAVQTVRAAGVAFAITAIAFVFVLGKPYMFSYLESGQQPAQLAGAVKSFDQTPAAISDIVVGPVQADGTRAVKLQTTTVVDEVGVSVVDAKTRTQVATFPMQNKNTFNGAKNWKTYWDVTDLDGGTYYLVAHLISSMSGKEEALLNSDQTYSVGFSSAY